MKEFELTLSEAGPGRPLRIGLAAENGEWHRTRLLASFRVIGIEPVLFSLADVAMITHGGEPLRIPGFEGELPDGVLLRTISGGTFEATTMRLGVLHALVAAGVVVWNDPRAIERCVDKSMTSLLIARAGLPTPDTFVVSNRDAAAEIVRREATPKIPLVLKPLFGSQGKGLRLIASPEDLPDPEEVARVYYLQRFVRRPAEGWRDYRVFVGDGRVVAAMAREGDAWVTNVHQGGRPKPWAMPAEAAELALRAARAVDVAFSGVDLIEDADGRFLVLEVNSMPSWSGLQSITDVDITEAIVRGFLKAVYAAHRPTMAAVS
jgi:RimK family alpha-L-glutamate ligase